MNPFHRTYARFHKKLLTKTMAIGVILALMGTACLIQLANIQLINGKTMAQAAAQSRTITVTLKARRGKIMDRPSLPQPAPNRPETTAIRSMASR